MTLSDLQRQALVDMGIDAWYLFPYQRHNDDESHQYDGLIEGLVDKLEQPLHVHNQQNAADSASILSPDESVPHSQIPKDTPKESLHPTSSDARAIMQQPRPITLAKTMPSSVSTGEQTQYKLSSEKEISWQQITESIKDFSKQAQKPYVLGSGNSQSDEFIVFPPSASKNVDHQHTDTEKKLLIDPKEQQLAIEMLSYLDVDWEQCYRTPLLKWPTHYGVDPDEEMINIQLQFFTEELALVQPQRIWLFGRLPCQSIMRTDASLSSLIENKYQLTYQLSDTTKNTVDVLCLPSFDYLLALPAEKSRVWQSIKQFT